MPAAPSVSASPHPSAPGIASELGLPPAPESVSPAVPNVSAAPAPAPAEHGDRLEAHVLDAAVAGGQAEKPRGQGTGEAPAVLFGHLEAPARPTPALQPGLPGTVVASGVIGGPLPIPLLPPVRHDGQGVGQPTPQGRSNFGGILGQFTDEGKVVASGVLGPPPGGFAMMHTVGFGLGPTSGQLPSNRTSGDGRNASRKFDSRASAATPVLMDRRVPPSSSAINVESDDDDDDDDDEAVPSASYSRWHTHNYKLTIIHNNNSSSRTLIHTNG